LAQDHTINRVYGFENEPYNLPIFLTPRIFALGYIRQRPISNQFHFSQHKQAITFKLPQKVGDFFVTLQTTLAVTEEMLQ